MTDSGIERGAAEDLSGAPVTPTDVEASRTPPSRSSGEPDQVTEDDGSGMAGGSSGGSGGGSGTPGHPDAA